MTDDLTSHDIEELRALMRAHHLLPEVPPALLVPSPGTAAETSPAAVTSEQVTAASEAMLARILATPRPAAGAEHAGLPTAGPASVSPGGPGRRKTRLRRRGALLAAAAATAVVAVVASQMTSPSTATAGTAPPLAYELGSPDEAWDLALPSARSALLDLSATAAAAPDLPRGGDVQRIDSYAWLMGYDDSGTTTAVYPTGQQWWTAADGSGQITQRRAEAVTYDGRVDLAAGPSSGGTESTDVFPAGLLDAGEADSLPTDPDALEAALAALLPPSDDPAADVSAYALAAEIVDQQGKEIVPQAVTAAMWEVLADEPSVQLLGSTTDRLGREGLAVAVPDVSMDDLQVVLVVLVSPEDGTLLGTETVTLEDPNLEVVEPTVTGFTVTTSRRWVEAVGG